MCIRDSSYPDLIQDLKGEHLSILNKRDHNFCVRRPSQPKQKRDVFVNFCISVRKTWKEMKKKCCDVDKNCDVARDVVA